MKRTMRRLAILLGLVNIQEGMAQETKRPIIPGVSIEHFNMDHSGSYLTVEMNMDLKELSVNSNRAVLLTPRLVMRKIRQPF